MGLVISHHFIVNHICIRFLFSLFSYEIAFFNYEWNPSFMLKDNYSRLRLEHRASLVAGLQIGMFLMASASRFLKGTAMPRRRASKTS